MSVDITIPYGRQSLDESDIQAVVEVLQSDWLTQGPVVEEFESRLAAYCGARFAVAVANGTAALHLAAIAAGFGAGDEVITSPLTFVASANAILYVGATPVFADIDNRSYCLDPAAVNTQLSAATRGVIPVHFSGQPCDMKALSRLAKERGLTLIEDAAHAIGSSYQVDGETFRVGGCAHSDMTIFSFHPVKHLTCGEGGMVTTNSEELYRKLISLRSHGVVRDRACLSRDDGPWYYEMQQLGYNYRITDIQCALGVSQLKKLDKFIARRREIVRCYNQAFEPYSELITPLETPETTSSSHLYVLQLKTLDRKAAFNALRRRGLGVNVHYIPVHLQPYYRNRFGYQPGDYPYAEEYYARALTLPLFPAMTDAEVQQVIGAVEETLRELRG